MFDKIVAVFFFLIGLMLIAVGIFLPGLDPTSAAAMMGIGFVFVVAAPVMVPDRP